MLASYQKISRVITGKPFGDGSDGAYSSATIPTMVNESCSGASGGTTLTAGGTGIADNDIVLIHQTRGTGAGNWEINKIASGGGSVNLVTVENLANTYTDSGNSEAQIIKILQYTDVTVESGTWSVPNWAGNTGGILVFAASGTTTITGTVSATADGYDGAVGVSSGNGYAGEGTSGATTIKTAANGNGGGGGDWISGSWEGPGGGGAGHASSGEAGHLDPSVNGTVGAGGGTSGATELTTMTFGGGGGSGSAGASGHEGVGGGGGDGGGIVFVFSEDIVITGGISANGENGGNYSAAFAGGGGGGSGGSCLIQCATATLGSSKITVAKGTGGSNNLGPGSGGDGTVGRIAVHHSGTVTGTTSPTFSNTEDSSLVESGKEFTVDGIVAARLPETVTVDGIVMVVENESITVDGIVRDTFTEAITTDALVRDTFTESFSMDIIIGPLYYYLDERTLPRPKSFSRQFITTGQSVEAISGKRGMDLYGRKERYVLSWVDLSYMNLHTILDVVAENSAVEFEVSDGNLVINPTDVMVDISNISYSTPGSDYRADVTLQLTEVE